MKTMRTNDELRMVVFDVAGTTVFDDDHVAHALLGALDDLGVRAEADEVARVMGLSKPLALTELCRARVADDELDGVVKTAHARFVTRMIEHYETSPSVRPIEGTETTFHALREEGIAVVLDTGFSRPILDAILYRLGWTEGVVDATVTSDEVPAGRPHPFMIQRALGLLGLPSYARIMKVGDTVSDIQEGLAADAAFVVGVLSGPGSRESLVGAGATHVLQDVSLIPRLVFGAPSHRPQLLRDRLFGA
jgi:phosphonatase-like hydrolase